MKYFSIKELSYSDTAVKKKIQNVPDKEQELNLIALVAAVLDPLREAYGKPIRVTSGFRCQQLNKAVGGAPTSQHTKGEAVDIDTGSKTENKKLARLIVDFGLPFDQLIDENNYSWVHVSYKRIGDNRGQILRYRNKTYIGIKKEQL